MLIAPFSFRDIFISIQEFLVKFEKIDPLLVFQLYLDCSTVADSFDGVFDDKSIISYDYLTRCFALYEENQFGPRQQCQCIISLSKALLCQNSILGDDYEKLVTRTAQFAAKLARKEDQCVHVARCANLFYPVSDLAGQKLVNPQRALECLQRALKLADSCATADSSNICLFIDILEHYLFLFENNCPVISAAYISGLVALTREHIRNALNSPEIEQTTDQLNNVIRYIQEAKTRDERFASVEVELV